MRGIATPLVEELGFGLLHVLQDYGLGSLLLAGFLFLCQETVQADEEVTARGVVLEIR